MILNGDWIPDYNLVVTKEFLEFISSRPAPPVGGYAYLESTTMDRSGEIMCLVLVSQISASSISGYVDYTYWIPLDVAQRMAIASGQTPAVL